MPLLSIAVFLPLLGALVLMALPRQDARIAHGFSIATTGLTFLVTLAIWARGTLPGGFAQVEEIGWIPAIGAAYRLGIDGLSLPLILLTSLLFLLSAIFAARVDERPAVFVVLMLMLETASIGTFAALDGLLFYIFFEVSLVGMYFMIVGWGYEDRQRAGLMFFIYTLLGSLPLLLAIIGLYLASGTFDMRAWVDAPPLTGLAAMLALIAMLFTFAVKTPVFPVHTWLGYVVMGVAVAALATDPGIRTVALNGATLQMISHGLVTGALFFLVGMLQDRAHSREMAEFGGLLGLVPWLGWAFVLSAFASLGLPGLAHFPAEFQVFLATLNAAPWAIVAILAIVVTAGLYLRAIAAVFLGAPKEKWAAMPDLDRGEMLAIVPLLILTILIGVAPSWLLGMIDATMKALQF